MYLQKGDLMQTQPNTPPTIHRFAGDLQFLVLMHNSLLRTTLAASRRAAAQRALVTRSYAAGPPPPHAETESYEEKDPIPDYPDLPWVSRQTLPAKGWDDMLLRRNYGDPVRQNL